MSDAHHNAGHDAAHQGGHEKSDLGYGPMLFIIPVSLAILVVFVTVIVFLSAGAASTEMTSKQYGGADAGKGQLLALRAHEDSILTTSGTDTAGHVRIPIAQAMAILAARAAK